MVPGRQTVEVVAERVEVGHEVRLDDPIDVLRPCRFLLRQFRPEGVHDAVADGLPLRRFAELRAPLFPPRSLLQQAHGTLRTPVVRLPEVALQQAALHTAGNHVVPQHHPPPEESLDVLRRCVNFFPVRLVLLLGSLFRFFLLFYLFIHSGCKGTEKENQKQ